ncbi:DUF91 domain-containing protein, partial [candidate division KSB1 bacterium]|nr:DUF91 domain-containing protein [candidate division KSB1 bacterium]
MSDIKLFQIHNNQVQELEGRSVAVEKSLQTLIEKHMEIFLGIRFLASEYSTGKVHGGRIDSLGIDENGYPVIVEYKRALNENVINQGLYYLDWLMDHKGEFTLLVMNKFSSEVSEAIEWSNPRLICIAGDFTKYDEYAVQQINRNIELFRYRRYGENLLLLELANATTTESSNHVPDVKPTKKPRASDRTVSYYLSLANPKLKDLYESLKAFLLALDDDVQFKVLKNYFAFKRIRNFVCVEIYTRESKLLVFVKVNPDTIEIKPGFTRDVREIGHFGTGDL